MSLPRFTFTSRARPFLEVGIGDSRTPTGGARWDVQRWDQPDALWADVEPEWQDVTCQGYEVRFSHGREATTDRFEVATMSVVAANVDGWADLEPPEPGDTNTLQLRPGRSIRFGVDHQTLGRVVLWRGYIDVVDPTYEPGSQVVRLQCIDALGEAGKVRLSAPGDPTGSGETVTARLGRILDDAGWPTGRRRLDGSSSTLLATKLDGQAADLLGRAADSNGGAVYADTSAYLVYRAMGWQVYPVGRPVDATIGNVGPGDVCPTRWVRPFARADIATRVILGNSREPVADVVQLEDEPGQGLYGVESFERTDLDTASAAELASMASTYLVTRGVATAPRVRSVGLDATTGDAVVDLLTTASPYRPSRYRCRLLLDRGLVFDAEHQTTGATHTITPDGWSADLSLDLAEVYQASGARWEPASGADAGQTRWDRAAWN